MHNFAQDIERAAGDEPIEAVVVGDYLGWRIARPDGPCQVASWANARPLLDYEYDTGYGGASCHAIWAWTPTRVLFVHEYDGSTRVSFVPRNPTNATIPALSGAYS